MYFKITKEGTFFTSVNNYKMLKGLSADDNTLKGCEHISYALGYSFVNGLYKINNFDGLYFFDSYRKVEPITVKPKVNMQFYTTTSSYLPSNVNWNDVDDGKTVAGKAWSALWGYTKKARNYFDRKHRVEVKLYFDNYGFYHEVGIKTKTQRRAFIGWKGQSADEIVNGWEILNLQEEWNESYIGILYNYTTLPPNFNLGYNYYAGINHTDFTGNSWPTLNIMNIGTIDISTKDKWGDIWNLAKAAGKVTVKYVNHKLINPNKSLESIRLIQNANRANLSKNSVTQISLAPYERDNTNTYRGTIVISKGTAGTAKATFNSGSTGHVNLKRMSGRYTFMNNSVLYGAARKGSVWKGVRITFK